MQSLCHLLTEEVKFEESLRGALDGAHLKGTSTNSLHMQIGSKSLDSVKYNVVRSNDPTLKSGDNNVDIDSEMASLAENQIAFKFAMKRLSGNYKILNSAIKLKPIQ